MPEYVLKFEVNGDYETEFHFTRPETPEQLNKKMAEDDRILTAIIEKWEATVRDDHSIVMIQNFRVITKEEEENA